MVLGKKKHWFIKCSAFAMLLLLLLTGSVGVANAESVNAESVVNGQEAVTVLYDYTEAYGWKPSNKDEHVKIESSQNSKTRREVVYLSVFVTFPDVTSDLDKPDKLEAAELLLNTGGEVDHLGGKVRVPSLKQLVEQATYGKLTTTSHIFPKETAGSSKVVSYTAPNPRSYYLKKSNTNPNGYAPHEQRTREAQLVSGAINAMKEQVSAAGITAGQLDSDNDGAVDAISFFIGGGMRDVSWSDLLWPHKIDASTTPLPSNTRILGKRISAWNLITGNGGLVGDVFSKNRPSYAVIFHEYLHTLGLPDLYRGVGGTAEPVGTYDVMADSTSGYPQGIMAVMAEERGWHNPLPEMSTSGTVTVTKPKYKDPNEKNAVKIRSPYSDKEYFVAEFYARNELEKRYTASGQGAAGETQFSDSDGLIVSRVKTDEYNGNIGKGPGRDMLYVFRPGETVAGEGRGKIGQATLNMSKGRSRLGKTGSSGGFDNETIYLSDGTNSGIVIELTAETADTITFNVTIPQVQGTGTETDPYLISEPGDFELIRNLPEMYFKITKDIDFSGVNDFVPIEKIGDRKPGVLDGNGKTIKNLTINNPPDNVAALFRSIGMAGVVKDLTFENLNVTDRGVQVAGVAASSGGTIENVIIKSGSITNTAEASDFSWNTVVVGGMVGYLRDTAVIKNSYNSASVTGKVYAGGLVGDSQNGSLINSYANGAVQAPKNGGIIGHFKAYSQGAYKTRGTYYDKNATGASKGINKVTGSVAVPADSGITGVTAPNEIALDLNGVNEKELTLTFDAASGTVTDLLEISVADTAIATVNNSNKIVGVSAGTTEATAKFQVGSHKMGLDTNVVVTGSAPTKPVPVADDLIADLSNRTYNKTAQGVTVAAKDSVTGLGSVTVKYKKGAASATATAPIQAGTYAVSVDIAEGSGYQAASDISLGDYTIDPVTLTAVSVTIPEVLVSSATELTGQTLAVKGTGIVTGDIVNATNSRVEFPSTATVGTFHDAAVTLGALDNGNYRVSNTSVQNQSYTVAARTLTRIYVHTPPTKTEYIVGERFDKTGMVVKAEWQGGLETDVTDQVAISPAGALSVGTDRVTIAYSGKTVDQSIKVKAKAVPTAADLRADLSNRTYNRTPQPVTVSAKDSVTGLGSITVKYKKGAESTTPAAPIQAGTYKVLVDIAEGSRYERASNISLGNYTIDPVTLTAVSVTIPEVLVSSATQLTNQTLPVRGTGIVTGDTVNATNSRVEFPSTAAVGTFHNAVVTLGALDNGNYRVSNTSVQNQSYTVSARTLARIYVHTLPTKTEYIVGERFDKTGMVVKAEWQGGLETDVTGQITISPAGALSVGTDKVTITYNGQTVEQSIEVRAKKVPVAANFEADLRSRTYNRTQQGVIVSAKPGVAGLGTIRVKYKRGGSAATEDIPVYAGEYEVLVDVTEGSAYQAASDISLGDYTIEPIRIAGGSVNIAPVQKGSPTQLIGQTLTVQGSNLVQGDIVKAVNCSITFPSTAKEGVFLDASVTIGMLNNTNYRIDNNRLDNQAYTVMAAVLNNIRITSAPNKTTYFEGESFDPTGMTVKAMWSDGTESDITNQVTITPKGALNTGHVKVTIAYGGKHVEQAVTVKKVIPTGLEIATPPTKTEYMEGEVFDASGLALTVTFSNGSTEVVTEGYQVSGEPLSAGTTEVEISYAKGGQVVRVSQKITVNANPTPPPTQPEPPKPEPPTQPEPPAQSEPQKPEPPIMAYPDVKEDDWFYSAVDYVTVNNIMSGYADERFGPSDKLGRAQFATILHRVEGSPEVSYAELFSDVPAGQFYSLPVVWASTNKVITGYENGMFGASDSITREQLATIMYRYAGYKGEDVSARADLNSFPDAGSVSSFAREAMSWAVAERIISGDQGKLNPQGVTSRAVAATIIQRFQTKK